MLRRAFLALTTVAATATLSAAVMAPAAAAAETPTEETSICPGLAFTAELACNVVVNDSGYCGDVGRATYMYCTNLIG